MAVRAAPSITATLGVAVATLVAVGGILAGPSILECSKDAAGLGACLRTKVIESGLIPAEPKPIEQPDAPAPPTGWMEANANEYEPPLASPVELAGLPMELAVTEVAPALEPIATVPVMPAAEFATAALVPSTAPVAVDLEGPSAGFTVAGAPADEVPTIDVALAGPAGQMTTAVPLPVAPIEGAAALVQPDELPTGALTATEPLPVVPAPVELHAEAVVEPVPEPEPIVIEFNPDYPNVLVLPTPATGDNSSFRSLQLN